uniref:SFRICE_017367 n=1 Tax=Spodoptera frugiperda TaxID=7108 RepID=A0A2H1W8V0_SPOFR
MSFLMVVFLLWNGFIDIQDCAVIHLDHSKHYKGIDHVLQKYLDPLRKLQAQLPNHAIEMQIEFHDVLPTYTKQKPQRRVIRVLNPRKPKPAKRSQDQSTPEQQAQTNATTAATTSTVPASAAPVGKVPVYMEDLQKALEELEKKLSGVTTPAGPGTVTTPNGGSCNGGNGGGGGGGGGGANNQLQTPIRSIDNIMEILRKGINIEHRAPKPSENLEWVQVKIPKRK